VQGCGQLDAGGGPSGGVAPSPGYHRGPGRLPHPGLVGEEFCLRMGAVTANVHENSHWSTFGDSWGLHTQ